KYLRLPACLILAGWGTILNSTAAVANTVLNEAPLSELTSDSPVSIKATTVGSEGEILTDQRGFSLYVYDADTSLVSKCTGECTKIWKPFLRPSSGITVLGTINSIFIGSLRRPDGGGTQLLFNGKPLYFYLEDKNAGDTKGKGKVDPIGKWSLIKPDGTTEIRSTPQEQPSSSPTENPV
ncbi:MAG: hypothetical protein ABI041_14935, partial [Bdellovibrionia bacterium]